MLGFHGTAVTVERNRSVPALRAKQDRLSSTRIPPRQEPWVPWGVLDGRCDGEISDVPAAAASICVRCAQRTVQADAPQPRGKVEIGERDTVLVGKQGGRVDWSRKWAGNGNYGFMKCMEMDVPFLDVGLGPRPTMLGSLLNVVLPAQCKGSCPLSMLICDQFSCGGVSASICTE